MNKHMVATGTVCAVLAFVSVSVTSSRAAEIYSYVGNEYTSTYGGYFYSNSPSCSGVSCDFTTISFTLASALGDNFSGTVTPTSFTASDGVDTITSADSLTVNNAPFPSALSTFPSFDIVTNNLGQITQWAIALAYTNNNNFSDTIISISGILPAIDISYVWNYCNLPNCGEETFAGQGYTPGNWSASAVGATPIPAALPLFATGLGAMGLFGWRRKRKNTAAIQAA
jgi:hypothetical protein